MSGCLVDIRALRQDIAAAPRVRHAPAPPAEGETREGASRIPFEVRAGLSASASDADFTLLRQRVRAAVLEARHEVGWNLIFESVEEQLAAAWTLARRVGSAQGSPKGPACEEAIMGSSEKKKERRTSKEESEERGLETVPAGTPNGFHNNDHPLADGAREETSQAPGTKTDTRGC